MFTMSTTLVQCVSMMNFMNFTQCPAEGMLKFQKFALMMTLQMNSQGIT